MLGKQPTCASCREPLSDGALRQVLSPDELAVHEKRRYEAAAASCGSIHCPTTDCPGTVAAELSDAQKESGQAWRCTLCGKDSCLACGTQPYHHGITCAEAKANVQRGEAKAERKRKAAATTPAAGPSQAETDKATAEYLERETRTCGRCGAYVQKSGGCDKVQCSVCGQRMCYRCGAQADVKTQRLPSWCKCTGGDHAFFNNRTGEVELPEEPPPPRQDKRRRTR